MNTYTYTAYRNNNLENDPIVFKSEKTLIEIQSCLNNNWEFFDELGDQFSYRNNDKWYYTIKHTPTIYTFIDGNLDDFIIQKAVNNIEDKYLTTFSYE